MMCKLSELPAQSPVALQSQHLPVPNRHHIMGPMGSGIQSATSKDMRACLPSKSGDQRSEAVALTSCELMHLSGKRHGLCESPRLSPRWLTAGPSHSHVMGGNTYRCAD